MRSKLVVFILLLTIFMAGTVPLAHTTNAATRVQSNPAFLNRTRFVVDLGLAFYAFHHFCYNPYKAGAFKDLSHHKADIVKCGLALLFTYNRVQAARKAANTSNSKTLKALVTPLNALANLFNSVGAKLKKGNYSASDVTSINSLASSIGSKAGGVKDIPLKIPGT
jgi:hypothetical protein